MSETKYYIEPDENHVTLMPKEETQEKTEQIQKFSPYKKQVSVWSKIGTFFGVLFSGLIAVVSFLIATPFFILTVLYRWIVMFIGLSIFWIIVTVIYYGSILNYDDINTGLTFNNTSIPILLLVALIGAILSTIGQIRGE